MNIKPLRIVAGSSQLWSACDLSPLWNATEWWSRINRGHNSINYGKMKPQCERPPSLREVPKRNRVCALHRLRLKCLVGALWNATEWWGREKSNQYIFNNEKSIPWGKRPPSLREVPKLRQVAALQRLRLTLNPEISIFL